MTYIMVDVESDGPIPGDYSRVCFDWQFVNWYLRHFPGMTPGETQKRCWRSRKSST
jgi:hypothetical protein